MENVNEKHKDTVFTFLFSNPDLLRELYSAIEGITLPPDIPININTLSDVLFRTQRNDILSKSRTLENYSKFIDKIREYQKEYQRKYREKKEILDKSFRSAINYCIKNNILKNFLKRHSSEVLNINTLPKKNALLRFPVNIRQRRKA